MGLWPWERATPVSSRTGPRCWEEPRVRRGRSLKAGATDSSAPGAAAAPWGPRGRGLFLETFPSLGPRLTAARLAATEVWGRS